MLPEVEEQAEQEQKIRFKMKFCKNEDWMELDGPKNEPVFGMVGPPHFIPLLAGGVGKGMGWDPSAIKLTVPPPPALNLAVQPCPFSSFRRVASASFSRFL